MCEEARSGLRHKPSNRNFVALKTKVMKAIIQVNRKKYCFALTLLLISTPSRSEVMPTDSLENIKKSVYQTHIRSTARIHTKGMFTYGGRISSDNPAFDINFIYDRKKWGFLFYKAFDLKDHTTANNFTLAVLYKNFKLGKRLTFTPNVGVLLEQPHQFADHGSDLVFITTTAFKVNPKLTLEHTALFGNLVIEPETRDYVNRLRLLYSAKHLDVTYMLWHNNSMFDTNTYLSTGLSIAYSRIPIADHFYMSVGLTELSMLQSSDERSIPEANQILFSLSLQFAR